MEIAPALWPNTVTCSEYTRVLAPVFSQGPVRTYQIETDLVRITTKRINIVVNPLKSGQLVFQTQVE